MLSLCWMQAGRGRAKSVPLTKAHVYLLVLTHVLLCLRSTCLGNTPSDTGNSFVPLQIKIETLARSRQNVLLLRELRHTSGIHWPSAGLWSCPPFTSSSESDRYVLWRQHYMLSTVSDASLSHSLCLGKMCLLTRKEKKKAASGAVRCWTHMRRPRGAFLYLRINSQRKNTKAWW